MDNNKNLIAVNEAAQYLGISPHTVRKYVLIRKLPFVKIGAAVRFEREALNEYIEANRVPVGE